MKTLLALVAALCGDTSTAGFASGSDMRIPIDGFLCETAEQAVQFADVVASGEIDEIAKDRVGRAAGAEVCGRYVGAAVILSERVELQRGLAYRITAYRFDQDSRVAWLAERTFAPVTQTGWDL